MLAQKVSLPVAGGRMRGALQSKGVRSPPGAFCRPSQFPVSSAAVCRAQKDDDGNDSAGTQSSGVPAALLLFVGSAAYTLTVTRDQLEDLILDDDTIGDVALLGLGLGDLAGAALWAAALWYASPWQLLLVFLGRIESERPSDWIMNKLGRAAGLPVDAIDYVVPAWAKAAAVASCCVGGLGIAALFSGLGDATWSVASGLGALFAAGIFEAGRPKRLTVAEAQQLEGQWQDFARWASAKLQRSGRCHESEVILAFRRAFGKYRSADVISDSTIRDMIRNFAPAVERTRTGYLKGVSLQAMPTPASLAAANEAGSSSSSSVGGGGGVEAGAQPDSLLDNIVQQEQQKIMVSSGSESSSSSSSSGGSNP